MSLDVWERFCANAHRSPDWPAIMMGDQSLTFGALLAKANAVCRRLDARGLDAGDRCLLWAENAPDVAAALVGVMGLRAIPVVVHAEAPLRHLRIAADRTGARHCIVDEKREAAIDFDGVVMPLSSLCANNGDARGAISRRPTPASDPASVFFTSGSSGTPKGVTQSHANLIWGCETVAGSIGLHDRDRILCAIPWAFDYGWGQLLSTLILGITQVLPSDRSSVAICEALERSRPTVVPAVPSLLANLIWRLSPLRDADRSSVRLITNTGSRLPDGLLAEVFDHFPDAAISLNYGLTETYRSASLPTSMAADFPDSVGFAIPGTDLAILDDEGQPAPRGEIGEIVHRGGGVFLGYWGEPERTAETRRPDPFWRFTGVDPPAAVFTGDLGYFDDGDRLHIVGRRDRQIKSMGARVSPEEVETLIEATGLVAEVAIVARPHEIVGEQVIAFVAPRDANANPTRELRRAARRDMSPFMQPMEWHVVDALPRTPNGKTDYPTLNARALELGAG